MTSAPRPPTAWKGSISPETDWISVCQLEIVSGKLQVHDASGPPSEGLRPPGVRESYGTFLIDGKGNIVKVFENVRPAEHSAELLSELGAAA